MSTAEEVDALILRILLDSEYGRTWLESKRRHDRRQAQQQRLMKSALDPEIVVQILATDDEDLIGKAAAMPRRQVRALNREWRKRTA